MKKKVLLFTVFTTLLSVGLFASGSYDSSSVEIEKEQNTSGPRRVPEQNPSLFFVSLQMDMMMIEAENYVGEITVIISGSQGGVNETVYISDMDSAFFDLSELPSGAYSLSLMTSRGLFSGEFVW